jgi:uncharacterized membrane protein YqjE
MSIRENLSIVAGDLVAMLRTRIELLGAEITEQKHRLFSLAALLLAGGLFLLLAIVVGTFLLVAFFWETNYRYWAIGMLTIAYALIGVGLIWRVCHRLKTEPTPFSASIEELHRDLVVLGSLRESLAQGLREPDASAESETNRKTGGHHE